MHPLIRIKRVGKSDREVIRALADAFAAEWPEWARTLPREALEGNFVSAAEGLPAVFAAVGDGRAIGTVALRAWFGDEPMEETPWVRGLWVAPAFRGRGVDRALMRAVEAEALRLGFGRIHAGTTSIERLGRRWGWQAFRRLAHDGEPMAWMYKSLLE